MQTGIVYYGKAYSITHGWRRLHVSERLWAYVAAEHARTHTRTHARTHAVIGHMHMLHAMYCRTNDESAVCVRIY